MRWKISTLATKVVLCAGLLMTGEPNLALAAEPVLLTVVGKIGKTNRPAFEPFVDAFFKFRDKKFETAYSFTHAELAGLPQSGLTARADNWSVEVAAMGPTLDDILKTVGAPPDAKISLVALDGYTIELESSERRSKDWVLAISVNGKPLAVGGRGPIWLMHDTAGTSISEEAESRWVWSVFLIEIE